MAADAAAVTAGSRRVHWRWTRAHTILPYALAGAALLVALLALGDELARHVSALERWIAGLGFLAPLLLTVAYPVLSSIFVPDLALGIAAGASFGFLRGFGVVVAGTLLGSAVQWALARRILKPAIDRFAATRPPLLRIRVAVLQEELKLQLLVRLTPLNRALTSYVLGAAGVRFGSFLVACAALLPSLALEVYCGLAGKHLARMTGSSGHSFALHDLTLVVGLVVTIVVMAVVSTTARKALEVATDAAARPEDEGGTRGSDGRKGQTHGG